MTAPVIDAVLLDDDELIHSVWEYSAQLHHKAILSFRSVEALLAVLPELSEEVPVFIDLALGHGIDGREVARTVHGRGFNKVYIATGYPRETLNIPGSNFPVVSKSPPWEH